MRIRLYQGVQTGQRLQHGRRCYVALLLKEHQLVVELNMPRLSAGDSLEVIVVWAIWVPMLQQQDAAGPADEVENLAYSRARLFRPNDLPYVYIDSAELRERLRGSFPGVDMRLSGVSRAVVDIRTEGIHGNAFTSMLPNLPCLYLHLHEALDTPSQTQPLHELAG